ncbi:hypothetical protein BGZ49_003239 [Haplosporangium sp. Z 27]|nr:hypothetical protein BGZ49_003239 [Haplosporangium sp. Z 27]
MADEGGAVGDIGGTEYNDSGTVDDIDGAEDNIGGTVGDVGGAKDNIGGTIGDIGGTVSDCRQDGGDDRGRGEGRVDDSGRECPTNCCLGSSGSLSPEVVPHAGPSLRSPSLSEKSPRF